MSRRQWLALAVLAGCEAERTEPAPAPSATVGGARASASAVAAPSASASIPQARVDGPADLVERYPGFAKIPILALGDAPTPIVEAPRLARKIGVGELWIKRDDRSSSLFSGSKVRKLARLLAQARDAGAKEIITFGGVGSNHAVATAAFGRKQGFAVTVRLAAQPKSALVAKNLAACLGFGARVESVSGVNDAFRRAVQAADRMPAEARPFVIAPGGTSERGDIGMLDAAFEVAAQARAGLAPSPEVVVLAMGTMGSATGIALGLPAAGLTSTKILAIRCSSAATSSEELFREALEARAKSLRAIDPELVVPAAQVDVDGAFLGGGYGKTTPAAERAIAMARDEEGIELEGTYTGKALAGLIARSGALSKSRVLFWASQPVAPPFDPSKVDPSTLPSALRGYLAP